MLIKYKNSQTYISETWFGRKQFSVDITNEAEVVEWKRYKNKKKLEKTENQS
jgi:hypothetical protein